MKANMGLVDRVVRAVLAIVVAVLYLTGVIHGTLALILGIVAIVFLVTGLVSFCPLYRLLGISTRPEGPAAAPAAPKP